jgi:transglutaminase-like putative cysteine protease
LKAELTANDSIIVTKENEIADLEDMLEQYEEVPDVDTHDIEMASTGYPYFPKWKVYYWKNGVYTKDVQLTPTKFYRIWSDDMYQHFKAVVKDLNTFDEKVVALRNDILRRTTYKNDVAKNGNKSENWRLPTETYYGKIGDCDDFCILWVTACKICELPADRVFNATGYVTWLGKEAGHSYGIAKFDDGEWYVVDSTSTKVMKLKGSDYKINGLIRGISNWKFSGVPKDIQF